MAEGRAINSLNFVIRNRKLGPVPILKIIFKISEIFFKSVLICKIGILIANNMH